MSLNCQFLLVFSCPLSSVSTPRPGCKRVVVCVFRGLCVCVREGEGEREREGEGEREPVTNPFCFYEDVLPWTRQ